MTGLLDVARMAWRIEAARLQVLRQPVKSARRLAWIERHDPDCSVGFGVERAALQQALDEAVRCRRCGVVLRHPDSAARGIGPECLTKAS